MSKPLAYYGMKALSRILCLLPYHFICVLGQSLGRLFYVLGAKQRNRAIAQHMDCMNVPRNQAEIVIKSLFAKIGQMAVEFLYYPSLTKQSIASIVELEGRENLDNALLQGKGVIVVSGHFGNWEMMGAALALYDYPVTTLVKPQRYGFADLFINEYRQKCGMHITTKGVGVRETIKALRRNRVVGFFIDQDGGPNGAFVDFLGKQSATPTGAATLALKLGAVVVPCFIRHKPGCGHILMIEPPLAVVNTGKEEYDIWENTRNMTGIVERYIRQYPDEWLWFQKRWNTKPKVVEQCSENN